MAPGFVLRILSILFLPLLTGTGGDRTMVERNDLNRFFVESGYDGSFLLYDLKGDSFVSVNAAATGQRFIPASTFKIFNSLVALETGVIADERTVIPWDGKTRDREILNRDHDLGSAIRYSVVRITRSLRDESGANACSDMSIRLDMETVTFQGRSVSSGLTVR